MRKYLPIIHNKSIISIPYFYKNGIINVMSKVEFIEKNEFHIKSNRHFRSHTTSFITSALLKTGIVKNEKQATVVLLLIIILTTAITFNLISQKPEVDNTIMDKYGNTYTLEEYLDLVKQGQDPLLPL